MRDVYRYFQERSEAQPDTFVRYEYRPNLLDASRRVIADYLNVPVETCVYTVNASMGIDTVLRNITYEEGDVILCFTSIYGSFGYTIQHLTETTSVEAKPISLEYPVSDEFVVKAFQSAIHEVLAEGKKPRLALFDTISSTTSAVLVRHFTDKCDIRSPSCPRAIRATDKNLQGAWHLLMHRWCSRSRARAS